MNIRGRVGFLLGGLLLIALCAPWRIAQASDGTLFLLKDGVRYAIVGEPIDDDELGAYAEGDPIGGSLLLNALAPARPPVAAPVGDAPAAASVGDTPATQPSAAESAQAAPAQTGTGGKRAASGTGAQSP